MTFLLGGCGWGGDPRTIALQVSPEQVNVQAGTAFDVSLHLVAPLGWDQLTPVTFQAQPGVACVPGRCDAQVKYKTDAAMRLATDSTLAPGDYSLTFKLESQAQPSSAQITLHVTPPPGPAPDFDLTVAPASQTATVSNSPTLSPFVVRVTFLNGLRAPVSISVGAPSGWTCFNGLCTASIGPGNGFLAMGAQPASQTTPGDYTITFTAVSGSLKHTATATVKMLPKVIPPPVIAAAPPTQGCLGSNISFPAVQQQPTSLAFTGGTVGYARSVIFDPKRNVILSSNGTHNVVDVIDPNTMKVIHRIPVPLPLGMDMMRDGDSVVVGSHTPYFYTINLDGMCVDARYGDDGKQMTAADNGTGFPTVLADGSILFLRDSSISGISGYDIWRKDYGFSPFWIIPFLGRAYIAPDRRTLYYLSYTPGTNGSWIRYDVITGSRTTLSANIGGINDISPDGSRIILQGGTGSLYIADRDLNAVSYPDPKASPGYFSPDGTRIYSLGLNSGMMSVFDGFTYKRLGDLPYSGSTGQVQGFDRSGRIITTEGTGILATSIQGQPAEITPVGISIANALTPNKPLNGYGTTLLGGGFLPNPSITMGGAAATDVKLVDKNTITLTAPALTGEACVDLHLSFPPGAAGFLSQGYCYRPDVLDLDGTMGPADGGATLTATGGGVGTGYTLASQIDFGQVPATKTAANPVYSSSLEQIKATTPPGHGTVDLAVSSETGTTIYPKAYTYVEQQVTPLPAGSKPWQMAYDGKRDRLLITDTDGARLLVYSIGSGTLSQTVPTGGHPLGVAVTPDGDQILVTTADDRKVTVMDAGSFAVLQQATLPTTINWGNIYDSASIGDPEYVCPVNGRRALIGAPSKWSGATFKNGAYFWYDLATNAITATNPTTWFKPVFDAARCKSSADGSIALLPGIAYLATTNTFNPLANTRAYSVDLALSDDGARLFVGGYLWNEEQRWDGALSYSILNNYDPLNYGDPYTAGATMNASGALIFRPRTDRIDIFDGRHEVLLRSIMLPQGNISDFQKHLLLPDPKGQRLWTVTPDGITALTYERDPLSIGRATLNGSDLVITGSGFEQSMSVSVDGMAVAAQVTGTTEATSSGMSLNKGWHAITVKLADGTRYVLEPGILVP